MKPDQLKIKNFIQQFQWEDEPISQKRHTPPEVRKRVEQLLGQGLKISQITERINITQSSAKRIRKSWEEAKAARKDQE